MKNEELKSIIAEAILKAEEMKPIIEDNKIKETKVRLQTKLVAGVCFAAGFVGVVFGALDFNIDTFVRIVTLSIVLAICGYTLIVMDKCRGTGWQITFLTLLISIVSLLISLMGLGSSRGGCGC